MNERERDEDALEREIAALYRELGREEPPPALDESIVRAAHAEVREAPPAAPRPLIGRRALSAAAGIMVAFLTALMFAGLGERVEVESVTAEAPSAGFVPFDAQGNAEAAPVGLAPGPLVEPLRREDRPPMVIRVIYQDADGRVVEERAPLRAASPQANDNVTMRVPDGAAEAQGAAGTSAPPAAVSGGGASAPPDSSGPAVDGVVRDSASQRQNLQELLQLVEQARLTETGEMRAASFRRSPEAWLARIQELVDEERLAEASLELDAFQAAHPDIDYQAELSLPPALNEESARLQEGP